MKWRLDGVCYVFDKSKNEKNEAIGYDMGQTWMF
jgi:hypothetical protein